LPGNSRLRLDRYRGWRPRQSALHLASQAATTRQRRCGLTLGINPDVKDCDGIVDERGVISVGYDHGDRSRWQIVLDGDRRPLARDGQCDPARRHNRGDPGRTVRGNVDDIATYFLTAPSVRRGCIVLAETGSKKTANRTAAARRALRGPQARVDDGASRCIQVKPAGASEPARVGARIPSKLAMRVRFSSPAPDHRS
jgi:hypothetical protein